MKYNLTNPKQGHAEIQKVWQECKVILENGQALTVTVKPITRSDEQNAKYHAMIGEIAEQAKHAGASWDDESWKRLLINKFCRETGRNPGKLIPNLDMNGVVEVDILSRNFSVQDATEFIEWLNAWAVENGVTLSE